MTLEQLLECSAAELKAMSDEQLMKHFAPFLNITRPDPTRPVRKAEVQELISPEAQNQMKLKIAKLKALGIDVDEKALLKKRKV